jgi:general secretion pathway protein I
MGDPVRSRLRFGGYTLIEVLVAFMILALALTVLLRVFSGGLRNVSASADYARAVLVAEAQLASAGVTSKLEPGETSGAAAGKYRWTQSVTGYSAQPAAGARNLPVSAYQVTVTVEWPHANRMRRIDLTSIRLATAGSGG